MEAKLPDGRSECRRDGGQLAVVHTPERMAELTNAMTDAGDYLIDYDYLLKLLFKYML